jgi:hypothetical protein
MRRYLALGLALLSLVAAGFLWTRDRPVAVAMSAPMPAIAAADVDADVGETLLAPVSSVTPAEREARRFGRYDKDRDGKISRDEYLVNRKKAFAKADTNGDGRLDFAEFSAATVKKFGKVDADGDGALSAAEFAKTAPKHKAKPTCVCEN